MSARVGEASRFLKAILGVATAPAPKPPEPPKNE